MRNRLRLSLLLLASLLAGAAHAARLGLVVGVNDYRALEPLTNAVADADAVAEVLRGAGFTVPREWVLRNPGRRDMEDAVNSLAARIKPGDEVFFYFSGHGVEIDRVPVLLPADVRDPARRGDGQARFPERNEDVYEATQQVQGDGIVLQNVAAKLAERGPRLSLLVVDACRDNPIIELLRQAQRHGGKSAGGGAAPGFAAIESGNDQVVVYAAGKGEQALDRLSRGDPERNSVFARVLLKKMRTPGLELRDLLIELKDEVPRLAAQRIDPETGQPHRQRPVAVASVFPRFYFTPPASAPAPGSGSLDLDDLKKQAAVRQQWQVWQAGMKAAFAEVEGLSATADTKLMAWNRYLGAYAQDNPFSAEDEVLRAQATQKRDALQEETQRQKAEAAQRRREDDARQGQTAATVAQGPAAATAAPIGISTLTGGFLFDKKPNKGPQVGDIIQDCAECPEMVVIPAGSFEMGSIDGDGEEKPVHTVRIGNAFALGKMEVTQGQWRSLMGSNPSHFSGCGDDCPVEQVSWNEVQGYVKKLNEKTGKRYRLPSEAEWEYACRAGGTQTYCGSDSVDNVAWYGGNSDSKTHPVAGKQANAWGLYDMSGNVFEWVEDCYHDSYGAAPRDGSAWTSGCKADRRVRRGASWNINPQGVRSAGRSWGARGLNSYITGFRIARTLP